MRGPLKILLTSTVVLVAAGAVAFKYWDYIANPWTRDGQVRANVIQVAPRVSGPIVKLPVIDNGMIAPADGPGLGIDLLDGLTGRPDAVHRRTA